MVALEFHELDPGDDRWGAVLGDVRHDIYHLPDYVALEASRTGGRPAAALVSGRGGGLLVPYLVRDVDGAPGVTDLSSPYGYSGALFFGGWDAEARRGALMFLLDSLRERGHCSLFLRLHPVLSGAESAFPEGTIHPTGETVIVDLQKSTDELWGDIRKSERYQARRLARDGYVAHFEPYAGVIDDFHEIYSETMRRVGATEEYFSFNLGYFRQLVRILGSRLTVCTVRRGDDVVSAKLYTESSGIVQNLFGGTYTRALRDQPSVLELTEAIKYFKTRGAAVMNLGGGLGGSHDSLFHFKASFSSELKTFSTARVVLDAPCYARLSATRSQQMNIDMDKLAAMKFFPLYRTPAA